MSLPRLMDTKALMEELGVRRNVAEQIIRSVPKVEIPGKRKLFVRESDVRRFLDEQTRVA